MILMGFKQTYFHSTLKNCIWIHSRNMHPIKIYVYDFNGVSLKINKKANPFSHNLEKLYNCVVYLFI